MLLIDASVYIFRAYHALPSSIVGTRGQPLNAVHGFADFLIGVLDQEQPERVVAAFDGSLTRSFRNTIYADYKANRETPPPDLVAQIEGCRALAEALGVATVESPTYEADDLIASLVQTDRTPAVIVTSDKDLAQLLREHDVLWDYARDIRYDRAAIEKRFGVGAPQIPDYLALVGDKVDNIPGVPGIGAKTAADLLAVFDSLEDMLAAPEAVAAASLRGAARLSETLQNHAEQARLSKTLATLVTDVPLALDAADTQRRAADPQALAALCDRLGAGRGLRAKIGVPDPAGAS